MVFSLIGSCNCVSIILIAGMKEVKHESVLYSSARLIFPNTVSQVTYNDSLSSTLQHLNVGVLLVKTACNLCLLFLANIIYYYLLQGTVFQPDFLVISPQYQVTMIILPSMSAMPLFILLPSVSSSFYHHTPLTFCELFPTSDHLFSFSLFHFIPSVLVSYIVQAVPDDVLYLPVLNNTLHKIQYFIPCFQSCQPGHNLFLICLFYQLFMRNAMNLFHQLEGIFEPREKKAEGKVIGFQVHNNSFSFPVMSKTGVTVLS